MGDEILHLRHHALGLSSCLLLFLEVTHLLLIRPLRSVSIDVRYRILIRTRMFTLMLLLGILLLLW